MTRQKKKIATAHLAHLQVAPADPRPKLAKELNLAFPHASLTFLCFILTTFFFVDTLTAQTNKTTKPKFETFKPINTNQYYTNSTLTQPSQQTPTQNYSIGATANDIMEQTYRNAEQQMGQYMDRPYLTPQQNQQARQNYIINKSVPSNNDNGATNKQHQELLNILNEANTNETGKRMNFEYYKSVDFASKTKPYTDALNSLKNMATGNKPISLKDAFYITENAYGNTYLSYKEYCNIIKENTDFIKQMMIQNGLDPRNNEAIHKAIQKFGKDTTSINLPKNEMTKITIKKHIPYTYDYIDYKGEKDFRNYFVTKAFATGTGQCSSLPVVYGILAESLGATFYLSTAPNHSFIKYPDNAGKIHNYEPTSHWNISDDWYSEHMYITPQAENTGIYLDTLNKFMIIGDCIANLGISYLNKYGVADGTFLNECINASMKCFPKQNNLQAILLRSSVLAHMLDRLFYTNGIKDLKDIDKVKGARDLYEALQQNELLIKSLGYEEMPAGLYEQQMNLQEFRGKVQQEKGFNGKEKRNLFININN
ncbi:MAG: hypothetical protein WC223_13055 [Bacteroidales bacterium]|jgi:hypothetical protein